MCKRRLIEYGVFGLVLVFIMLNTGYLRAAQGKGIIIPDVSIKLINPDHTLFGMPKTMEITLADVTKHHGHCGAPVALSFRAAQEAFKALYGDRLPAYQGVKVYLGTSVCYADTLAYITGARTDIGSPGVLGDFVLLPKDKKCIMFVDKRTGKKVTINLLINPLKTIKPLKRKALLNKKLLPKFQKMLNEAIHQYIFGPADSLFKISISEPEKRTITDMDGNRVELPVPENIERVAILTSPTVQLIYIMGEQDKLCAMTASQRRFKLFEKFYPRQKMIPAPRKCMADMNIEALLATNPQFCIGTKADMNVVRKNTRLRTITVDTLSPTHFFKCRKEELRLFGKIFGKPDRAEKYCAYLDNVLSDIKSKTTDIPEARRVKVFMGFGPKHMITYGGDTYMQDLIVASRCRNVAEKLSTIAGKEGGLSTVSMEQVLTWNPDIVIIDTGNPAALAKDRVWAGITAVKNGNVFRLPVGGFMWNRASAEVAVLLPRWLALKAYPDRFPDMKAESEIKKYFHKILGFDLSDKDVKRILNPPDSPLYKKGK